MKYLVALLALPIFGIYLSALTFGQTPLLYDHIVVRIENRIITQNQIALSILQEKQREQFMRLPPSNEEILRKRVIKALIDDTLLDLEADRLKIEITDDELDAAIINYRDQNRLNEVAFEQLLENLSYTREEFSEQTLNQMRRERVIYFEIRSKVEISNEEIIQYYDTEFKSEPEYHVRHILRRVPAEASKEIEEKARQEIIWLSKQIKNGNSFEKLVAEYSQDPAAKNTKGVLTLKLNEMVKEFSQAISLLKPNILSAPVKSPFGYHLIELLEIRESEKESFEKKKDELREKLYAEEFEQKIQEYFLHLRKKSTVIFTKT